jgi:hypothetical protein
VYLKCLSSRQNVMKRIFVFYSRVFLIPTTLTTATAKPSLKSLLWFHNPLMCAEVLSAVLPSLETLTYPAYKCTSDDIKFALAKYNDQQKNYQNGHFGSFFSLNFVSFFCAYCRNTPPDSSATYIVLPSLSTSVGEVRRRSCSAWTSTRCPWRCSKNML